jgi:NTE family protein
VAADFRTATEVVFSEGKLSKAIRASIAIPGIFKPVNHDGMKLVDGGMLNNLPADVVRKMGADIIIAVDLTQNEPTARTPDYDFSMISGVAEMLGFGGLLNWVANRPDITKYADNKKLSTICISPVLPNMDASSFGNKNSRRMIKMGEEEAMKHWDELMQIKAQVQ